jgi:hypothetical protein
MKRAWWIAVVALAACKRESAPDAPPRMKMVNLSREGCNVDAAYRIRFRSNNTDGWWLRLAIAGDSAHLTAHDVMTVLPDGPLALTRDECKATIRANTDHSGDVTLAFVLDPATNVITGTLSRTKGGELNNGADTTPISGRRDIGPPKAPPCIKPGIFALKIGKTKWKLSQGTPRAGTCADFTDLAHATVRVEPFGDELVIDEVDSDKHEQGFSRGKVTKKSDCEYDLELAIQDFSFAGTITFAGDKLTGTARTTRYQFFEDGEAGENLWACKASGAPIEGTRVAD